MRLHRVFAEAGLAAYSANCNRSGLAPNAKV